MLEEYQNTPTPTSPNAQGSVNGSYSNIFPVALRLQGKPWPRSLVALRDTQFSLLGAPPHTIFNDC